MVEANEVLAYDRVQQDEAFRVGPGDRNGLRLEADGAECRYPAGVTEKAGRKAEYQRSAQRECAGALTS